jgi:hypothetical protein
MTKWGNITWCFFHTLAEKIHPVQYQNEKNMLMQLIKTICNSLPCPDCSEHATQYMLKRQPPPDKEGFRRMMFDFHNVVNLRTGKRIAPEGILSMYRSLSLTNVFHACKQVMLIQAYNPRLIMHKVKTKDSLKQFHVWLGKQGLITH